MLALQLAWIVASAPPRAQAQNKASEAREVLPRRSGVDPMDIKDQFVNEPVSDRTQAEDDLDDSEIPLEIWARPPVPPAHIGYTTEPPFGFGEPGNEDRSVTFENTSECRRYFLRIFIDNIEVVPTDGEGEFGAWVEGGRGAPISAHVLPPNERTMHIVDVGRHQLRVERFAGPGGSPEAPLQYVDTCTWPSIDFTDAVRGVFRFNAAICHKVGPSF